VQYNQLAPLLSQGVEPVTKEMIESALSTRGLKAQTLSISDGTVKLQIQSAAYANVMEWVAEMQKSFRLVVEDAKLTGLAETGQVSVSFTMRQIRQGAN
jgi:type II secretory pathway component PulM